MLTYVSGDLFRSPAQTLVNTVNTVGVMGKGVALTFKRTYPEMFKRYRTLCEAGEYDIGKLFLWRTPHKWILNLPTKKHWRNPSRPEYVDAGLNAFVRNFEKMRISSVAFPPLGCGNGELDFANVVRPIMDRYLCSLPIQVYIYAPHPRREPPEHRQADETARWLRSTPADLSFDEVWNDLMVGFRQREQLETIARNTPFEAQYVPEEDSVRFWTPDRTVLLQREEFADAWRQLRAFGFLTTQGVPAHRARLAAYMFPVLSRLPYVRSVTMSEDFERFTQNPRIALQLVPPAAVDLPQHELELA